MYKVFTKPPIFLFLNIFIFIVDAKCDILDDIFRKISKTEEKEALILAKKGEYEKALQIIEPLTVQNPDSSQIVSLYIWLKIKLNKINEAWNFYSSLKDQNIVSDNVKKELIENFTIKEHKEAVILAKNKRYDEALKILDDCIKLQPDNKIFKADKILVMLWKNDRENAMNEFKKLFPEGNPPEYLNDEIKKLDQEIPKTKEKLQKDEVKAEEINESENTVYSNKTENYLQDLKVKAVELARNNKYEDAIKIFKEILAKPENLEDDIINDYIVVLSWSGADKEAVEFYENNFGKFKEKNYLYKNLAKSYLKIEKPDTAFTLYKKALDENPLDTEALKGLSFAIFAKNGQSEANKFLEEYFSAHSDVISRDIIENIMNEIKSNFAKVSKKISEDPTLEKKNSEAEELIKKRDLEKLMPLAEELFTKYPDNPNALIIKVYALQIAKKPFDAFELNERILKIYPDYTPSLNTKYHILLDIGAAQLAKEKLEKSNDKVSIEVKKRILGDLAAEQIKFLDPKKAIELLDQNIRYSENYLKNNDNADTALIFKRRAQFDKFLAMREMEMMRQIVEDYENLKKEGVKLPYWALEVVGDAYLYLKKPEKAVAIYDKVIEYYKENDKDKYPYNYNVLMAKFVALIELERHYEAMKILEELDQEIPYFARPKGILTENWYKVDILIEKAWSLIFDDRLNEAENYIEELIESVPYNSNPRVAQAYLHLYREFPRLALEDFEIATNLNPENKAAAIGKAYALDENDRSDEGREIAQALKEKYPNDLSVQKLNRYFEIQDMRLLSVKAEFSHGGSFVDGAGYTVRLEQPIYPHRKIYAETLWLQTKDEFEKRNIFRSGIGFDWRINRDLSLQGGFSLDHQGREPGISGGIRWNVDDHLSLAASYNSYSLNLPPKALLYKYKGQEAKITTTYRFSEDLITEASFSNIRLSDGNNNQNYTLRIDKGLSYSAHWKTRLAVEGSLTTNRKYDDRGYYAPKYAASLYFVPMVEHMWFRRYDFSIFDRIYFGIGPHWEKSYKVEEVWFIRYEQEWRLTDTFYFKVGGQYGKSKYGRDNPHGWNFYTEFYWNF